MDANEFGVDKAKRRHVYFQRPTGCMNAAKNSELVMMNRLADDTSDSKFGHKTN